MRWIVAIGVFVVGFAAGVWFMHTHSDFERCRAQYTDWSEVGECLWILEHP